MKRNFYKLFLCFVLAVVLPFSFVGCKKSSKGDGNNSENSNNGGNNQNPQEESYVLNDTEITKIVGKLSDANDEFITSLNAANLLKPNDYPEKMGDKTYPVLNYAYYPSIFYSAYSAGIKKDKTYAYINDVRKKYLEIKTNENNDKIFIKIATNDSGNFVYFNYEITTNEGEIDSVSIAFLETKDSEGKRISFSQSFLDYKNKSLETSFGLISEFSSTNEQFFKNNFTKDKFALIPENSWGYSFYQKLEFGETKNHKWNTENMPSNSDFLASFDKFEFLDAFDKNNEYKNLSNDKLTTITNDIFSYVDIQGKIVYSKEYFTFEKAN